ncbi:MBL fold metallo-hydrolase [Phytomonospora sp. NPDC050363]|uniref:MBL fold metallo-hydrolase n=1 Tax=Phytomonospora sp. NPDC050363 TaxID=3155642 RepID=UPI0033EE8A9A
MTVRAERLITSGKFTLDGGSWDVDNNVWLVGDDEEVVVIDAAHDAQVIAATVAGRKVKAIVCTHAHDDHVNAAPELAELVYAPVLLHPADRELWDMTHPSRPPDGELEDGQEIPVGGIVLRVMHTPGHAPGAVSLYSEIMGAVFTGDTLFKGGPGATGRSFSDFPTIITSIRERLLWLPPETTVYTGHGDDTTIGDEAGHLEEWIARGH